MTDTATQLLPRCETVNADGVRCSKILYPSAPGELLPHTGPCAFLPWQGR